MCGRAVASWRRVYNKRPGFRCNVAINYYNIEHSKGGLISFPGGVLITSASREIIGAMGVSGSSVENDHAVAQAGADAVK